MIGIIGAMSIETEKVCSLMDNKHTETIAGMTFTVGELEHKPVIVCQSGVGKVFAALCAQIMITHFQVDQIIGTGVAGTLTDQLHICDLAIAVNTVQHDMDTSAIGDPVGLISGINCIELPCAPHLIEAAQNAAEALNYRYVLGTIATGDQFVSSQAQKDHIVKLFRGIACEMEGGAIGHACYINKIPYVIIRAISDEANGEAPSNFMEFAQQAADRTVGILVHMVKSVG